MTGKIGFVGMTHLGLNSLAAAAEKNESLVCFDPNEALIQQLKQNKLPVIEPGLPELIHKYQQNIEFTHLPSDLKSCDLIYISPDIPTDGQGKSDLNLIHDLIRLVEPHLHKDSSIVILSQVPPGFTAKLQCNVANIYYQVETLIFGRAIERATKPERFIVGTKDPLNPLNATFEQFLKKFNCPILKMRYESAELTKIAINMFLVSSVTTTNTIAELSEKIGADWAEIVPALQYDRRIGPHAYLQPGLGIAGGNLERDLATFTQLADSLGTDAEVVRAWKKESKHCRDWVIRKLHEIADLSEPLTIGILGLSYKKDTSSLKNSAALDVLSHLIYQTVRAFDPAVKALPDCFSEVEAAQTPQEVYQGADILIVMTPWDSFRSLSLEEISQHMRGNIIIDPYKVFSPEKSLKQRVNYHTLGVSL